MSVLHAIAFASLLFPLDAAAQIGPVGTEFQVNSHTTGPQYFPAVAASAEGSFVVVWQSYRDADTTGVSGQRFDNAGQAIGTEFQVNGRTASDQRAPVVAASADGSFVVAWQSYRDGDATGVFGQRYDSTGQVVGAEFQVNGITASAQRSPAVAAGADGSFVVTWESYQDGSGYGVFARRYDSAGQAMGAEFQVNSRTASDQRFPAVTAAANGAFVVVWESYQQDGSGYGVFGQRYDDAGKRIGSEFQVDTYTADFQRSPAVAAGANGAFVVVWQSYQDGEFTGVFGQHYDGEGAAVATEFQVNSHTVGNQRFPSVAARATGSFVVTWQSYQDGSGYGVFAKRYDSAGQAVGTEFQANSYTTSSQGSPSITAGADEAYVVIWHSIDQDGSDAGVFGQRFGAPESSATPLPTSTDTPLSTPTPTQTVPASATPSGTETATVASSATSTPPSTSSPTAESTPTSTASLMSTATSSPTAETTSSATATQSATVSPTSTRQIPTPVPCAGDCGGDGTLSIDELIAGVAIALGHRPIGECPSFDTDESGRITIDELVAAVDAALNECGK